MRTTLRQFRVSPEPKSVGSYSYVAEKDVDVSGAQEEEIEDLLMACLYAQGRLDDTRL